MNMRAILQLYLQSFFHGKDCNQKSYANIKFQTSMNVKGVIVGEIIFKFFEITAIT